MYSLHLTETRSGLEFDIDLDPDQRVYCFIGENGAGKTSLLDSLAEVLLYCHTIWRGAQAWKRQEGSLSGFHLQIEWAPRFSGRGIHVSGGTLDGKPIPENNWALADLLAFHNFTPPITFGRPFIYIPAAQRATIDGIGPAALRLVGDRLQTFASAVDRLVKAIKREPIEASTVAMWFAARLLVNPSFFPGMNPPREEVFTLLQLLSDFDPEHFSGVLVGSGDDQKVALEYVDGQLRFMGRPIDRLASGYVALIKILQELVSSIAAWEAVRNSSDILGSDAVVLIDELDAHLHPRWQRNLLPFLKARFPNATFMITTHSPLVVRDTEPSEAYELVRTDERVSARRLGSPRDWYLSEQPQR